MFRYATLLVIGLPLAALTAGAALPQKKTTQKKTASASAKVAPTQPAGNFERDVLPLIQKYCVGCHTAPSGSGAINLSSEKSFAAVLKSRTSWDRVSGVVLEKRMPPADMPQPTDAERKRMGNTLESLFSQADCQINDPGRVTMRRLNRAEYNNTIRDLLGVNVRPADDFPNDDVGYGFDNIGDVLSLSPLLMEKYLSAAAKTAQAAIIAAEDKPRLQKFPAGLLQGPGSISAEGYQLATNGEATIEHTFPVPGTYTIIVRAGASTFGRDTRLIAKGKDGKPDKMGPEPAKMAIQYKGAAIRGFDVFAGPNNQQDYKTPIVIEQAGKQKIGVAFLNDAYDEKLPEGRRDRNFYIESVSIEASPEVINSTARRELPFSHRKIVIDTPDDTSDAEWNRAAKAVLAPLAHRAFRRPVTEAEVTRLIGLSRLAKAQKQSFEKGIQLALQGILVSPSFLFRPEPDAKPDDPSYRRQLNDHELATRLSYFLWSSLPDDELLGLADQKKLQSPGVLLAQAKRMLKDPRSRALAENFAGQWLQLRKVSVVQPDTARFPSFNDPLRNAMRTEAELFFSGIVQEDRSVLEFLDSDYTYLNETLAKHYGTPGVQGEEFRRVALQGAQRGGVLSMASVLTLTSNPGRTSPVKRGKWVLENLLGTPPPPPPPNIPALDAPGKPIEAENLRKRLEIHRSNPACASCHAQMDAIGLAMENYDAIGKWRTDDAGKPMDVSGTLPDGNKFTGPKELKRVLLGKKSQFTKAMTERLLTYALGRGVERTDRCNLDAMAKSVAAKNHKFSAMVEAVITSKPFRERRGDESTSPRR